MVKGDVGKTKSFWHYLDDEAKASEVVFLVFDAIYTDQVFVVCDLIDRSGSFNIVSWVVGSDFIAIFAQKGNSFDSLSFYLSLNSFDGVRVQGDCSRIIMFMSLLLKQ